MRVALVTLAIVLRASGLVAQETIPAERATARAWFRDARFGMFIHWGVYSQLGQGEWGMENRGIPVATYEWLASAFNPIRFDAHEWVSLAKTAGVRYITITSRHHDGFSMFATRATRYARSGDACVIGRQRHRHTVLQIDRQRMARAAYSQNYIITGQANLNQDFLCCHLLQQSNRVLLLHYINAMADALSVAGVNRSTNMKEIFRWNQFRRQLAGVQRDVNFWIELMEIVEHLHVQAEIVDRHIPVLWHHKIQADHARIFGCHLKADKNLCKHHFLRQIARHLIQVARLDSTTRVGILTRNVCGCVAGLFVVFNCIIVPNSS